MSEYQKSYRIKYTVKCKLQNFFDKEIVVKRCMSELHAKTKLDSYCKKKYGIEYLCIVVTKCTKENDIMDTYNKLFGNLFDDDSKKTKRRGIKDYYDDILERLKKQKK